MSEKATVVRLTFKDPDALHEELRGRNDDEADQLHQALGKWITYGEYVAIDFDLAAGTASVVAKR